MAQNDFHWIIGDEHEWYQLWRYNSVPCCLIVIELTPLEGHLALKLAHEPMLVVTLAGVTLTFPPVINKITCGTKCQLINMLYTDNANLIPEGLNTSINQLEN